METQPAPTRARPATRDTVASSPASTASRRSGPNGLLTDRTKAHAGVAPASGCSGTRASSGGVVVLDQQQV
ncbi:hypothetical protein, partial [Micromonospora sp. 4G55]|uniref:hypothetical protein n=1 Tax=Micromonospora sp. 4G55 TaxID=2806102 RepID=UPI001A42C796